MNEKGRKLIEFCGENKLSVGNILFEKMEIHKFICVRGVDGCKILLDLIMEQKEDNNKLLDVNLLRCRSGIIVPSHNGSKNRMLQEVA